MIAWIIVYYSNRYFLDNFLNAFDKHIDNCELYIVDNSAKNEISKLRRRNVTVLVPDKNLGFGGGVNYAKRHIETSCLHVSHVVISNYDITLNESTFIGLRHSLTKVSINRIISPLVLSSGRIWFAPSSISKLKICPKIRNFGREYTGNFESDFCSTDFVSGCFIITDINTWKILGEFDEKLFMYDEDVDLSLRAVTLGIELLVDCTWYVDHVGQGSYVDSDTNIDQLSPDNSSFNFYVSHTIKNRRLLIRKHFQNSNFLRLMHSLYWILKSTQLILIGKISAGFWVINELRHDK